MHVVPFALLIVVVAVAAGASGADTYTGGDKIPLGEMPRIETDAEFHQLLDDVPLALALYMHQECAECFEAKKALLQAQAQMADPIPMVHVWEDALRRGANALVRLHSVGAFPTVNVVRHGKLQRKRWRTGFSLDDVTEAIKQLQRKPFVDIATLDEAKTYLPNQFGYDAKDVPTGLDIINATAVIFARLDRKHAARSVFADVADQFSGFTGFRWLHTTDADVANFYSLPPNSVTVYNPTMATVKTILAKEFLHDVTALKRFVVAHGAPSVSLARPATYEAFFNVDCVMVYTRLGEDSMDDTRALVAGLERLAFAHRRVKFLVRDYKQAAASEAAQLGISEEMAAGGGVFVIFSAGNVYRPEDDELTDGFSADAIADFVTRFEAMALTKWVKSEPIPEDNPAFGEGKVVRVVGRTWDSIVMNTSLDVLLMIDSPSCKTCAKMYPVLDEVAAAFTGNATVVVAVVDKSVNEVHHAYNEDSLPAFYMASALYKDPPEALGQLPARADGLIYILKTRIRTFVVPDV